MEQQRAVASRPRYCDNVLVKRTRLLASYTALIPELCTIVASYCGFRDIAICPVLNTARQGWTVNRLEHTASGEVWYSELLSPDVADSCFTICDGFLYTEKWCSDEVDAHTLTLTALIPMLCQIDGTQQLRLVSQCLADLPTLHSPLDWISVISGSRPDSTIVLATVMQNGRYIFWCDGITSKWIQISGTHVWYDLANAALTDMVILGHTLYVFAPNMVHRYPLDVEAASNWEIVWSNKRIDGGDGFIPVPQRYRHTVVPVSQTRCWFVGGADPETGEPIHTVEEFDSERSVPCTQLSWTLPVAMTWPLVYYDASNQMIYIMGGTLVSVDNRWLLDNIHLMFGFRCFFLIKFVFDGVCINIVSR